MTGDGTLCDNCELITHLKKTGYRLYLSLVTMERVEGKQSWVLPDDLQGACGWLVVVCASEDELWTQLTRGLDVVNLKPIELEDIREINCVDEVADVDEILASNVPELIMDEESGNLTWGVLHRYFATGEA